MTSRSSSAGGEIEAAIRPATESEDAGALERARLERELADAEGWLAAARDRLTNDAFVSKAPPAVVDGARAREAELADQVDRLRDRLGALNGRAEETTRPFNPSSRVSPSQSHP